MIDDRDPVIQRLFDVAKQDVAGDDFVADIMARIDRKQRNTMLGWAALALFLLPVGWLLVSMLQDVMQVMTQIIPSTLIDMEGDLAQTMLAPVNSIGAIIALGLLGLRMFYKWIFG